MAAINTHLDTRAGPALDGSGPITIDRLQEVMSEALEVFLRGWGQVGWRELVERVQPLDDPELLRLIATVSAIELDATFMRRKLRATGVVRLPAIQDYSDVWLSEEVDHGRAFDALVRRLSGGTIQGIEIGRDPFSRDRRVLLAFPGMWAVRPFRRATLAGYFVRGICVESQAIAIYGRISRVLADAGEEAGAVIVKGITAQEGRHLRLFRKGAEAVLGSASLTFRTAVRKGTEVSFRPPGVDLFGRRRWAELMQPLLSDADVVADLVGVDARIGRLPGFEGSSIVGDWFADLFADHPEVGPR